MVRSLAILVLLSLWAVDPGHALSRRSFYRSRYFPPDSTTIATTTVPPTLPPVTTPTPPPPAGDCSKEFLFFEFTTVEPAENIRSFFAGVTVLHAFKVYGACRYIFLVLNDQSEALKNLTLPADASVNVDTFPIEKAITFYARFGIGYPNVDLTISLPDQNLVFVERKWSAQGLNEEQYAASVFKHGSVIIANLDVTLNLVNFIAVAQLDTRFLFFWNVNDCTANQYIFRNMDALGGPEQLSTRVMRIFNLP